MIKVGLLGLGFVGKIHLFDGYNKLDKDKVSLEACFDLSMDALSEIDCPRKYTCLDTFFENECGKLDCVDICLPTFMHSEIAIKAMKCGFHVLCEKPMALSVEDAEKMYNTSVETGKKLMIAHVLRFDEDYIRIKEFIDSEVFGKPMSNTRHSVQASPADGFKIQIFQAVPWLTYTFTMSMFLHGFSECRGLFQPFLPGKASRDVMIRFPQTWNTKTLLLMYSATFLYRRFYMTTAEVCG